MKYHFILLGSKKHRKANGEYPIYLEMYDSQNRIRHFTGQTSSKTNWNKKQQRVKNNDKINQELDWYEYAIQDLARKKNELVENLGAKFVRDTIFNNGVSHKRLSTDEPTLVGYMCDIRDHIVKHGTKETNDIVIKRVEGYEKTLDATGLGDFTKIGDVNFSYLKNFEKWLIRKKYAPSTIKTTIVIVKHALNLASNEGLIAKSQYDNYTYTDKSESVKVYLTEQEVLKLEQFTSKYSTMMLAKKVWLFCYYTQGMRVGDALQIRWSDINDGLLRYTMAKTGDHMQIRVHTRLKRLLTELEKKNGKHVTIFNQISDELMKEGERKDILKRLRQINANLNSAIKRVAEHMGIEKSRAENLTMHGARHSFTIHAIKNLSVENLMNALGHKSLQVTTNYIKSIVGQDPLDEVQNFYDASTQGRGNSELVNKFFKFND